MLRGNKTDEELRFELFTWGAMLLVTVVLYLVAKDSMPGLMLFIPGLIMLGSAIFQDMQVDWKAGWLTYLMAMIMVGTGLAGILDLFFDVTPITWLIIAVGELGAVLIAKAIYDPSVG